MNKHCRAILAFAGVALAILGTSCQFRPKPEVYVKPDRPEFVEGTYEHFVYNTKGYPKTMETYRNYDLLKKAKSTRCKINICLSQQRGRMYVDGQVAADWPVSTGVPGRETPTGKFSIVDKKKEYASNSYGNIYNEKGRLVKSNADLAVDAVPEGGKFVGSPMPNWMRLTWDGVGMHTGKVSAGQRLSHGCIRTPGYMASELFDITRIGTPVTVAANKEPEYPALAAMAQEASDQEAAREQALKDDYDARLREWETNNPGAARRYAERQAQAKAKKDRS